MNKNIYSWIWKWHFIGGLVCLPIVIILSITGTIYLFKDNYEKNLVDTLKKVEPHGEKISFQQQWELAKQNWDKTPTSVVLPNGQLTATEFVSGRFSHKSSLYINPYSGEITGKIQQNKTDMYKVRKLHGELLLGSLGTKIVELVASWMVVLLLSGVYLFWPRRQGLRGLYKIRINSSKRVLFRDLHAVTGFWFSGLLLLILIGGLPWTDVFGGGFKWIQDKTDAGFPKTWKGRGFVSQTKGEPLMLDAMIDIAKKLDLTGNVSIALPQSEKAVFSVSNQTPKLSKMVVYHFDPYSGELMHKGTWSDIGIMMKTRLWVMAFHQGQFGLWNLIIVLITAIALLLLSVAAIVSYIKRKQKGDWGIPEVPTDLKIGKGIIGLVIALGLLLPLFGLSVILIFTVERIKLIAR